MVEPIMYLGLGFLVASLLALITVPFVHARAVRLTLRRLEAATPLSMAEIQADKDQLRAEFAISTRRLEMTIEQLRVRTTTQLAELGRKTDMVNRMKLELEEKTATIAALEAREKALREQLGVTEAEPDAENEGMESLPHKQAELEESILADSQRIEIVALKTQVETLKTRIGELEQELRNAEDPGKPAEIAAVQGPLSLQPNEVEELTQQAAQLARQLADRTRESEALNGRVAELEEALKSATDRASPDLEIAAAQGGFSQGPELQELTARAADLERQLSERTLETETLSRRIGELEQELRHAEERSSRGVELVAPHDELSNQPSEVERFANRAAQLERQLTERALEAEALTRRIGKLEEDLRMAEERAARERLEAAALTGNAADQHNELEEITNRASQLERQLADRNVQTGTLSRRIAELETQLAQQGLLASERERERDQFHSDLETIRKIADELRQELAISDRRHSIAAEALGAEKMLVEAQLDRAREDRANSQREIAALKREAESSLASERVENALLRERINEVAAEVARLTAILEGPGSPIEAILAQETAHPQGNGSAGAGTAQTVLNSTEEAKVGSLADRIRALQARAARLQSA